MNFSDDKTHGFILMIYTYAQEETTFLFLHLKHCWKKTQMDENNPYCYRPPFFCHFYLHSLHVFLKYNLDLH